MTSWPLERKQTEIRWGRTSTSIWSTLQCCCEIEQVPPVWANNLSNSILKSEGYCSIALMLIILKRGFYSHVYVVFRCPHICLFPMHFLLCYKVTVFWHQSNQAEVMWQHFVCSYYGDYFRQTWFYLSLSENSGRCSSFAFSGLNLPILCCSFMALWGESAICFTVRFLCMSRTDGGFFYFGNLGETFRSYFIILNTDQLKI